VTTALDVVRQWKERMRARDFEHLGDIVDLDGYTEICLGLTGWTTGYDVALKNYVKNMVQPWTEMEVEEEQVVDGPETVVVRSHTRATHSGEFLGIPGTGRRIEWDAITMVQVKDGRVVGQWAQPDLFSIYRQISDREILGTAGVSAPLHGPPPWARPSARV
jgi:predicted ester cyclase